MDEYSINDVLAGIECGEASETLQRIKLEMVNQISLNVQSNLWVYSSIVHLSLEMIRRAMGDCKEALVLDENNLMAYFIYGICYLWKDDENTAMQIWQNGTKKSGSILTNSVLLSLIENCSLREYVRELKFDVKSLIDFHEFFSPSSTEGSSYGISIAHKYMEQKNYSKAITYYTIIF